MAASAWGLVSCVLLGMICETVGRAIHREEGNDIRKLQWLDIGLDMLFMPKYIFYRFLGLFFIFVGEMVALWSVLRG